MRNTIRKLPKKRAVDLCGIILGEIFSYQHHAVARSRRRSHIIREGIKKSSSRLSFVDCSGLMAFRVTTESPSTIISSVGFLPRDKSRVAITPHADRTDGVAHFALSLEIASLFCSEDMFFYAVPVRHALIKRRYTTGVDDLVTAGCIAPDFFFVRPVISSSLGEKTLGPLSLYTTNPRHTYGVVSEEFDRFVNTPDEPIVVVPPHDIGFGDPDLCPVFDTFISSELQDYIDNLCSLAQQSDIVR